MRYAFIQDNQHIWTVRRLCSTLDVHHSGYYVWLKQSTSKTTKKRQQLSGLIKQFWLGINASVEDVLKKLELPDDAQSMGYIIRLPDPDEFVAEIVDNDMVFSVAYAKLTKMAKIYDEPELAIADAKKITKHKLLVCVLFES